MKEIGTHGERVLFLRKGENNLPDYYIGRTKNKYGVSSGNLRYEPYDKPFSTLEEGLKWLRE
ncbi:hypothetical protein [Rhodospirillum rubrum]|uniref:hypothetical protein n=1 Tax=Rhodospirillum rubrum TaxID=1085 RepID=UPI0019089B1E|nr:hypothetical protein [Rhodospirillum rubrum]